MLILELPKFGPHMFMRGQGGGPGGLGGPAGPGGPGGPGIPGGRQQSPGFFNRNNAFERGGLGGGDMGPGFGGRGRGGRGGMGGRGGGRGGGMDGRGGGRDCGGPIWSDDEGDENVFKRRGGGVNRFRDDDRHNNMRDRGGRGGRGGLGGPGGRDHGDRDNRSQGRDNRSQGRDNRNQARDNRSQGRGVSEEANRRSSRDDVKNKPPVSDTEEDWDNELEDLQEKNEKKTAITTHNISDGDEHDGTKSPFRGDNGKTRRNSEVETPMVIQIKNKVVDPDEENWDDDEDDNRPLPNNPQQEVTRQVSPTPPTSVANVSNIDYEKQMSSESRPFEEDIIRKESPVMDQQPAGAPPAIAPSCEASPPSTSSGVSALAPESTPAAETETEA